MNLFSKNFVKNLFKKRRIYPSKGLGQNFLIDKSVLQKIIKAANLSSEDIILEIGPGTGNLTAELAERTKKVIAVEKDRKMAEILKETLKGFDNIAIIQGDILEFLGLKQILNPKFQVPKHYKVVANLPYYIASPVIREFLENKNPPKLMILMVQKEVAQRICASPPKMNLLAVSVQFYAKPEIISYVSKKCFWPAPKVDSAIIKIIPKHREEKSTIVRNSSQCFFRIVKSGFSHPRKQILNNLSKCLKLNKTQTEKWFSENNIKSNQRAETLSVENWKNLAEKFPQ